MNRNTKSISGAALRWLGILILWSTCNGAIAQVAGKQAPAAKAVPAQLLKVGVSWSNFQEERWKRDESAIKQALARYNTEYLSMDARGSSEKQAADIDAMVAAGAKTVIVLAWDAKAILPAVERALARGVAIVAYDRLIEHKDVFYITFDNVEVGRIQAREILKRQPQGNYVFLKGADTDANADLLFKGQMEVLAPAIQSGRIKNLGDRYTEGWKPEIAQQTMLEFLAKNNNRIDAVIASNDGTAGGAIAALHSQGVMNIPVSGQDADTAALNRIALGQQSITLFKDPRKLGDAAGWVASQLAHGKKLDGIVGTIKWNGGSKKITHTALLLAPTPITTNNLKLMLAVRWITKKQLCAGVDVKNGVTVCREVAGRSSN